MVEPFLPGDDLDKFNDGNPDSDAAKLFKSNPTKVDDRKFMVEVAKKNDWFINPDVNIDCGSDDNDHTQYWTFAKEFSENFKFVITSIEGNHRVMVICYTLMGLTPSPIVPLTHESREAHRITKRYLDLPNEQLTTCNIRPTETDDNYLDNIKKMMAQEPNTNMLTKYLYINIYTPTTEASPIYKAPALTENLIGISKEISGNRHNSSESTNMDGITPLIKDITTSKRWSDRGEDLTFFINDVEIRQTDFFNRFNPQQFRDTHQKLNDFFEDPNEKRKRLNRWVTVQALQSENTENAETVFRGRPMSTMQLTTSPVPKPVLKYQPMWDMLLLYQLLWTNESYFNSEKMNTVKILAKAHYMARWIRSNIVMGWGNKEWDKMSTDWKEYVKDYDDKSNYIGTDDTGGTRPGCGLDAAQINAVTVLQFHMIQACEIGDKTDLLAKVIDRMKTDFSSKNAKKDQPTLLSKCCDTLRIFLCVHSYSPLSVNWEISQYPSLLQVESTSCASAWQDRLVPF